MRTIREVADLIGHMTQDERALVEEFILRLSKGRQSYGDWVERMDHRDFRQESLEEVLDLAAYLAMAVHRLSAAGLEGRQEALERARAHAMQENGVRLSDLEKLGSDEPVDSGDVPIYSDDFELAAGTPVEPVDVWPELRERIGRGL
jgi:hypothetical protein